MAGNSNFLNFPPSPLTYFNPLLWKLKIPLNINIWLKLHILYAIVSSTVAIFLISADFNYQIFKSSKQNLVKIQTWKKIRNLQTQTRTCTPILLMLLSLLPSFTGANFGSSVTSSDAVANFPHDASLSCSIEVDSRLFLALPEPNFAFQSLNKPHFR